MARRKVAVNKIIKKTRKINEIPEEQVIATVSPPSADESKKKRMMWLFIFLIMVMILIGWVLNLKNVFEKVEIKQVKTNDIKWDEIREELSQTLGMAKEEIEEFKNQAAIEGIKSDLIDSVKNMGAASSTLPEAENIEIASSTILENLKNKIEDKVAD